MALNINGTTGISGVDGSASAPAVTGTDSNTGINFGSDTVNINTGGSTRATIDSSGNLNIPSDDKKLRFGGSNQFELYYGSSKGEVRVTSGSLNLQSSGNITQKVNGTETAIACNANAAVELYYNNSKKFETKNDGVKISQEVVIGNATNAYPWSATGDVAHGVLLNSLTNNVEFPISGNSNDTITCILNRTNGNGRILEFKYNGSVVGNVDSNGSSLPSDKDFKTNISDLNLGLSVVNKLKPSQFNYKIDDANTPVMYGLIAQDLEETLTSEGVTKNSTQLIQHHPTDDTESNYSVDYLKLLPILINSIKELSTEVVTLKTKVAALEAG